MPPGSPGSESQSRDAAAYAYNPGCDKCIRFGRAGDAKVVGTAPGSTANVGVAHRRRRRRRRRWQCFRRQSRPEGSEEILQEIAALAAVAAETELPRHPIAARKDVAQAASARLANLV